MLIEIIEKFYEYDLESEVSFSSFLRVHFNMISVQRIMGRDI